MNVNLALAVMFGVLAPLCLIFGGLIVDGARGYDRWWLPWGVLVLALAPVAVFLCVLFGSVA